MKMRKTCAATGLVGAFVIGALTSQLAHFAKDLLATARRARSAGSSWDDEFILRELLRGAGWPHDDLGIATDEEGVFASMHIRDKLFQFRLVTSSQFKLISLNGQEPPADLQTPNLPYSEFCAESLVQ